MNVGTDSPISFLIVDDEADARELFLQVFADPIANGQYIFHYAADGISALNDLASNPDVSVVLLDIRMPRLDGFGVLERLQEKPEPPIVVLMTAYGDMANIRASMNRGAFDFLTKPLDLLDLQATIARAANHALIEKERRRKFAKLQDMEKDLEMAAVIQKRILPLTIPEPDGASINVVYRPLLGVGGDFYDFHLLDPKRIGVLLADVTGHGLAAALDSSTIKIAFRNERQEMHSPGQLINNINNFLCELPEFRFVSAAFVLFDLENMIVKGATAGHPPFLLLRDGVVRVMENQGLLLAVQKSEGYTVIESDLRPGDRILLFTDGLYDMVGINGYKRLVSNVESIAGLRGTDFVNELLRIQEAREQPAPDDVSLLTIEVS
ncbi:MAG: SpoIIE family protein phosphatase [Spirochaetia bacterium]|nr:SpoIIE family protein phosphatase [Spirochaetia bacterium]